MIRKTTDVLLPASQYTAKIVTYWSFEDRTEIANASVGSMKVSESASDAVEKNLANMEARSLLDLQFNMVKRAVVSLVSPEGVVEEASEVSNLPAEDIDFLFAEHVSKIDLTKKKSPTT